LVIPLDQFIGGFVERIVLVNDIGRGERGEVSFRRFGIYSNGGGRQVEEPQLNLIDNPGEEDSSYCAISGECRGVLKRKIQCVVKATLRSVEGGYLSENGQISFSAGGRGWIPIGGGYPPVDTGVLEQRFRMNLSSRNSRLFGLVSFPGIGCQVSEQIQ
jgi:hypothetical protein